MIWIRISTAIDFSTRFELACREFDSPNLVREKKNREKNSYVIKCNIIGNSVKMNLDDIDLNREKKIEKRKAETLFCWKIPSNKEKKSWGIKCTYTL